LGRTESVRRLVSTRYFGMMSGGDGDDEDQEGLVLWAAPGWCDDLGPEAVVD
jgi:hypothetical protein